MSEVSGGKSVEYVQLKDEELWLKLKAGDKGSLAFIYRTYCSVLYNYGIKLVPDEHLVLDCIHDLFVTLWQSRRRLSVTNSIKFYLFACLKRAIMTQSKLSHKLSSYVSGSEARFEFVASPENDLILRQTDQQKKDKLLRMINKLPKRQKEVLFLRYYEGLSAKEVASLMSLSINSTYVLLSKALNFLKRNRDNL